MSTPRLLPCPCCGGPARFAQKPGHGFTVECGTKQCVTSKPATQSLYLMAETWNTRRPAEHSQLEVLRKVEQMAAYYEAPKGFFDWLDLQVSLHGGTPTRPQQAGFLFVVTPATAPEASQ